MDKESPPSAPQEKKPESKTHPFAQVSLEGLRQFFRDDPPPDDLQIDEKVAWTKFKNISRLVRRQSYIIIGLVFCVIVLLPVMQPVHKYEAVRPDMKKRPLPSLSIPNQTDRSILSWAATSITEIMTFGFGDIDTRLLGERYRFTDEGWLSFVKGLYNQNIREKFKMQQLVLTTVPTDAPVIVAKGIDADKEYKWIVEMPVIMTYMTNNNVTQRDKGIARLTIVRVPTYKSKVGIGIKKWEFL